MFWQLEDGRRLADVRSIYRGEKPEQKTSPPFDWTRLHAILEALPEGRWTTYGDLADAVLGQLQHLEDLCLVQAVATLQYLLAGDVKNVAHQRSSVGIQSWACARKCCGSSWPACSGSAPRSGTPA